MVDVRKLNKSGLGEALVPKKIFRLNYREELSRLYEKLYFDNMNYFIISNLFFLSLVLSLIVYIFLYPNIMIWFDNAISSSFLNKIIIVFLSYFLVNLVIYYGVLLAYFIYNDSKFKRSEHEIEQDLPEFIDNLVSNLKGGISLEKALLKSVRVEQKALLREVTLINEKILMGMGVIESLKQFRERFSSPIIHRTFFLVEEGLKGGGNLAGPLERISENLKRIYELDEEIKAGAGGFTIVIMAISVFVAPLLFALALTLLTFIGDLFTILARSGTDVIGVAAMPPEFGDYLIIFSWAMIIMITFFASLITSQLKNEKIYVALKYVPVYIIISVSIYYFASDILLGFFSGIIN